MKTQRICHEEDAFVDALISCMDSGLTVLADGIPLTRDSLRQSSLIRESGRWEGDCLRDEAGQLTGLSFSQISDGQTLLQKQ